MNSEIERNMEALRKRHSLSLPLWEQKDQISKKNGAHAKLYMTNGDTYHGEWRNDLKHGNGTYHYKKSGFVYEGEWASDERSGYGTLSIPVKGPEKSTTTDVATFIQDLKSQAKKEVATVTLRKMYAGQWLADKKHGLGTCFYENGDVYHGNWESDMKEGWGQMQFVDGSMYEGEWHLGKRHGQGILLHPNGDRYEGMWFNDLKEGPGKFVYRLKRQIYEGEWAQGMPRCGVIRDLPPLPGKAPRLYPIPSIGLENPQQVLDSEKAAIFEQRAQRLMQPGQLS